MGKSSHRRGTRDQGCAPTPCTPSLLLLLPPVAAWAASKNTAGGVVMRASPRLRALLAPITDAACVPARQLQSPATTPALRAHGGSGGGGGAAAVASGSAAAAAAATRAQSRSRHLTTRMAWPSPFHRACTPWVLPGAVRDIFYAGYTVLK
jgi:hypothetical protein